MKIFDMLDYKMFYQRFYKGYYRGRNLLHSKFGYVIGIISLQLILMSSLVLSKPQISPGNAKLIIDPTLDGRKEIANFNLLMDQIFVRMNLAIRAKNLDPMDLKVMSMLMANPPKVKVPRFERSYNANQNKKSNMSETGKDKNGHDVSKVKAWLHGMSTLNRTEDVSIFFHETYRTIQCPFSLGPLELKVTKRTTDLDDIASVVEDTIDDEENETTARKTKSAKAITDLMLGLMDFRIDKNNGKVEITDVIFDEPGGVSVQGSLKRRANLKTKNILPYKLMLAAQTAMSLKDVAKLVVGLGK